MKLLIPFILLSSYCFATDHVVCSGSGVCSVTSMSGLTSGDRLLITPGVYSSGNFSNLTNIIVTYQTTRGSVKFSGTVTMGSNTAGTTLTGISFSGTNGISFSGNNTGVTVSNCDFRGVTGDVLNSNNGRTFNGTNGSYTLYNCVFDSLYLTGCGYFHRIGFGQIGDGTNFTYGTIYKNIRIDQTVTNGEQVRGVGFELESYNWLVTHTGSWGSGGDVGIFTLFGNMIMHEVYSYGMQGYVYRCYCARRVGSTSQIKIYNCVKGEGVSYGFASFRTDASNIVSGVTTAVDTFYMLNNTEINCGDASYISPAQVVGSSVGNGGNNVVLYIRNFVGINTKATNNSDPKNHIVQNDAGGNITIDTAFNKYYTANASNLIDGSGSLPTYKPTATSILTNAGTYVGLTKDFYGVRYPTASPLFPPIGFAMFPPACGGCPLFLRQRK